MAFLRMSWEGPEPTDPDKWKESGEDMEPMYRTANWSAWWQHVLDSDWATDSSIQLAVGPEYLMYYDMEDLPESKQVIP